MAVKEYSAFSKSLASLEPSYQIAYCHIQNTRWGESYSSAEMQLMYSLVPANWAQFLSGVQLVWIQNSKTNCHTSVKESVYSTIHQ